MSVWKKIPIPPGGVMPGGMVTKIGVAAISLLLAATLLTYTFTGGGGPEAEIDVPEAAGFDLQQRAAAAIAAEARRQAELLSQQAEAAERQLAQLQNEQESTAALLGAGIVGLPGQDPGTGLLADDQPVPFAGDAPRTEAEAVLLETLRLEEMERRRRSLRTAPLVLSYRNSEAAVAELPGTLSGRVPAAQAPLAASPGVTAEGAVSTAGEFLQLLTELNDRELAATAQPAPAASGPPPSLARLGPEAETPLVDRPTDPDGWDRIYEGSFLEAVLVTELSGEFPGPVLANVSVPFYSADRQRVLIPRGARVVGTVGAVSGADQERLAVAFHRIIWPDGRTVSLEFNGLNQIGESALKDAVDRHYFSMFAAAGAVGILSGLTAMGSNPYAGGRQGFQAGASQGLGEGAVRILDRFLNRLPTITIRAGHRLRIWFTGDVLVPRQPPTDRRHPMTMKHAIAFSLTLAVAGAMPPGASAQFDLDLQATEITNQIQQIANRVTRYTTLLNQFTNFDCSAQGMAAGAQATPVDEAAVVCDTLNMIGAFKDSYQQLLAAPTDLLNTPVPLPDWRDVLQAADTVTAADIRNIYQSGPNAADPRGCNLRTPPGLRRSQRCPLTCPGRCGRCALRWHLVQ